MSDSQATYKDEAIGIIAEACDEAIHQANDGYSSYEVLLFPLKRMLACAWLALPEPEKERLIDQPDYAMLVHEAGAVAGVEEVTFLAQKIIMRAVRFETHAGMCLRIKHNLICRVMATDGSRASVEQIIDQMVFPAFN